MNDQGVGSILVVEDDEGVRGEVRTTLEESGYAVLEAGDGREALQILFADDAPDIRLIVSDLAMPRMSGSEMLQILSSYSRSSRITAMPSARVSSRVRVSRPTAKGPIVK